MTPIMSLLLIGGLVAGLIRLRWRDSQNLRNLPAASKRLAVMVHLVACLILALFVWLFAISLGTPLTDYLGALGLLVVEGLIGGIISSFILFSRLIIHIPLKLGVNQDSGEVSDKEGGKGAGKIVRFEQIRRAKGKLPNDPKVISIQGRGHWTDQEAALDEESNSQMG